MNQDDKYGIKLARHKRKWLKVNDIVGENVEKKETAWTEGDISKGLRSMNQNDKFCAKFS